jgi:predicted RNase H-like HicB family nuclease
VLKVLINKCGRYNAPVSLLFTIFVEVTEDGDLVGRCLEIPRTICSGKILEELRKNMADAISLAQVSRHELFMDIQPHNHHIMALKVLLASSSSPMPSPSDSSSSTSSNSRSIPQQPSSASTGRS